MIPWSDKPLVYFAHSMRDYGNVGDVRALLDNYAAGIGAAVLDPEQLEWNELVEELGSHDAAYAHVIEVSQEVCALEHQGMVGRGVYEEVKLALEAKKPVHAVKRIPGDFVFVAVTGVRIVNRNDWKVSYGRLVLDPTRAWRWT